MSVISLSPHLQPSPFLFATSPWNSSNGFQRRQYKMIPINSIGQDEGTIGVVGDSILVNRNSGQVVEEPNLVLNSPTRISKSVNYWNKYQENLDSIAQAGSHQAIRLLVGMFNLFAVALYAIHQQFIVNSPIDNTRMIYWQVQKVLDDLVVNVGTAESANEIVSRSLHVNARDGKSFIESNILVLIAENTKSQMAFKQWIKHAKKILLKELISSTASLTGPKLDPKVYIPIKKIVRKILKSADYNSPRDFSPTLLEDISSTAKLASKLGTKEIQDIFKTFIGLGKLSKHYKLSQLLSKSTSLSSILSRSKRSFFNRREKFYTRRDRRMKNSRYSRPDVPIKLAVKAPQDKSIQQKQTQVEENKVLQKRKGFVMDAPVHITKASSTWADVLFSLLTETSPLGLDLTMVYAEGKSQPSCLAAHLCRTNSRWRRHGPLHAALAPLLSILISWSMEETSGLALATSLSSIRNGWLQKNCQVLYPQCPLMGGQQHIAIPSPTPRPYKPRTETPTPHMLLRRGPVAAPLDSGVEKEDLNNFPRESTGEMQVAESSPITYNKPQDKIAHNNNFVNAFYERYNGEGAMAVPGTMFGSNLKVEDTVVDHHQELKPGQEKLLIKNKVKPPKPKPEKLPSKFHHHQKEEQNQQFQNDKKTSKVPEQKPTFNHKPKYIPTRMGYNFSLEPKPNKIHRQNSESNNQPRPQLLHSNSGMDESQMQNFHQKKQILGLNPEDIQQSPNFSPNVASNDLWQPNQPNFLTNPEYSSYMASQNTNYPTNQERNDYFNHDANVPVRVFNKKHMRIPFYKPRPPKYRYGLRRGLPAGKRISSKLQPEMEAGVKAQISKKNHSKINRRHYQYYTITPSTSTTPEIPTKQMDPFQPHHAITDALRNERLYAFIRDQKILQSERSL